MSIHCLVILTLIFALPSISLATSVESTESGVTAGFKPWKGQSNLTHRHHLKNVHGILNIFGWGLLLPTGAIVARNFRKFPLKCDEWYQLHTLCQTSGYIIGTVGWGIGIWLGNSSRQYTLKAHRILGIIIFTFATLQISLHRIMPLFPLIKLKFCVVMSMMIWCGFQILAVWLQPKREDEWCKLWEIYHIVLGYTVIVLSIANIFEGIDNIRSHAAEKWRWVYVGMLLVLASTAVGLEIYRWIKSKNQQQLAFDDDQIYASQPI